jgi:hypothetical protein
MTAKAMMSYIANKWQEEKNAENFQDANDETLSETEVEVEVVVKAPAKKGKDNKKGK